MQLAQDVACMAHAGMRGLLSGVLPLKPARVLAGLGAVALRGVEIASEYSGGRPIHLPGLAVAPELPAPPTPEQAEEAELEARLKAIRERRGA